LSAMASRRITRSIWVGTFSPRSNRAAISDALQPPLPDLDDAGVERRIVVRPRPELDVPVAPRRARLTALVSDAVGRGAPTSLPA
jgi:hypothetical protein